MKTSFAMMIIIAITKATGFLYSALVAKQLGASRESDLFLLANTIPELLGNLILVGLIGAALIPVLIKAEAYGHTKFLELFNSLLNFLIAAFVVISIIIAIFADRILPYILIDLINGQFAFSTEDIDRIVSMMRVLLIPQVILGVSAFYSSGLNVFQQFLIPQLAPLFYNFGRILGALFLIPILGGVEGLVWGTLLGSVLHLLIQIPTGRKVGIRHIKVLNMKDDLFVESIRLGVPRLFGIGAEYIAVAIDRFIAARFIYGSVTAFDFAIKLISLPIALFGLTFSVAALPTLSKMFQSGNIDNFKNLFTKLINQVFFLAIPVTVMLLILRVPFVRLFYGIFGGEFDLEGTYLTAWIVAFMAIGLVFESVRSLLYRSFYAAGDTMKTLYAAVFTMVFGMVSGIMFTNYFSHFNNFNFAELYWDPSFFFISSTGKAAVGGLALSSSLVYTMEFILLIIMFNKYIVNINLVSFVYKFLKKILAGVLMGIAMFLVFKLWGDTVFQTRTLLLMILVGFTVLSGLIIYIISSYLLNIEEFSLVYAFLKKLKISELFRTFRKPNASGISPVD